MGYLPCWPQGPSLKPPPSLLSDQRKPTESPPQPLAGGRLGPGLGGVSLGVWFCRWGSGVPLTDL